MSDRKRLKGSTGNYIPRAGGSTSDVNDPPGVSGRGQSDSDLRPEQSSGEQNSQQTRLSPPTRGRRTCLLNRFSRKPSSPPPPARIMHPNNTIGQPIATSASQLLAGPGNELARRHSSHVGSSASAHGAGLLQMQLTSGPGVIEPLLHSSVVWAEALKIAEKKLIENNLPPLNLTNLTSRSAEENIQAVVKGLHTLQEDNKKKQWSYTWRGKKFIVMEQWGKFVKSMEKYTQVVNAATQALPKVGALVWASILAIMQVCIYCTLSSVNSLKRY